ncbi:MAG: fatty acid desaturase, partial [Pseudomonadota bacterium]
MASRQGAYKVEWPTLGLIAATYGAWALGVLYYAQLSSWIAIPLLALTLTLHSSLQHETIHGHPLPNRTLSAALMFPALGLFVPYGRFRDLHLIHHKDARLTDPYDDPESAYFAPEVFQTLPGWAKAILRFNNTLVGRIVIGPLVGLEAFYRTERQLLIAGSPAVQRDWLLHL